MFEIFPDGPVPEYSLLTNVVFSFLWAFVLASIIAVTHRLTHRGEPYPKNFFQSLILGAIVTTMVMMAIGDSLARGLGVFGAMAIIRFRTRIDDPRDVLFLFAALSTGLAIGVYGYTISFAGTILFCLVAFLLHLSPFRAFTYQYLLSFTVNDVRDIERVLPVMEKHLSDQKPRSVQSTKENVYRYEYAVVFQRTSSPQQLMEDLKLIEEIKQVRIESRDALNLNN